jgi:predicted SprT family Zn-dependent metalloprotease
MNERIFNRICAGWAATVASNLEPKLFESNNLESFFSPTVPHEVHHQNFKHQQRHPSRNP